GEVADAISALVGAFKCESAVLVRVAQGAAQPKTIASAVARSQRSFPPRVALPFIQEILHPGFGNTSPGTVWAYSNDDDRAMWKFSLQLDSLMNSRAVRDIVLIALQTKSMTWDFLELHLATKVSDKDLALMNLLAISLSNSWASRMPGLTAKLQNRSRISLINSDKNSEDIALLDISNPAGLSRSEYRICHMIQDGMVAKSIANELTIRENTVRSHLHSIYSKTQTSGQIGLLHRLMQDRGKSNVDVADRNYVAI
ncbi:MAG: helix-turn-helix transcriptional regulator, partial [Paracoccaceae bacterium]